MTLLERKGVGYIGLENSSQLPVGTQLSDISRYVGLENSSQLPVGTQLSDISRYVGCRPADGI